MKKLFTRNVIAAAVMAAGAFGFSASAMADTYDADQVNNSGQIVLSKGAVLNADSIAGTEGSAISNVKGGTINLTGAGNSNLGTVENNGTISVKNGSATANTISGDSSGKKGRVNVGTDETPAELHVSGGSDIGTANISRNSQMSLAGGSSSSVINNSGTLRVTDGANLNLDRLNGKGGKIENSGKLNINGASNLGQIDNRGVLVISGDVDSGKAAPAKKKVCKKAKKACSK